MTLRIHQILIRTLLIDGSEILFPSVEDELILMDERHRLAGNLLVSPVPSCDFSVQIGNRDSRAWVLVLHLPQIAQMSQMQSLIGLYGGPASRSGSSEECCVHLIAPFTFEFSEVRFCVQVPRPLCLEWLSRELLWGYHSINEHL